MHYGILADDIHGDKSQVYRERALNNFRSGHTKVLIATDVAARGIDVPAVTHVIQYDMPVSAEEFDTYVHRIGRTGRAGHTGLATGFFVPGGTSKGMEGNSRIAVKLTELLTEAKQEIPDWLVSAPLPSEIGDEKKTYAKSFKAGFKDIRSNQSRTVYNQKSHQYQQHQQQQQQQYFPYQQQSSFDQTSSHQPQPAYPMYAGFSQSWPNYPGYYDESQQYYQPSPQGYQPYHQAYPQGIAYGLPQPQYQGSGGRYPYQAQRNKPDATKSSQK